MGFVPGLASPKRSLPPIPTARISMSTFSIYREDDGTLPHYAWPGGYPLYYLTADNAILCPWCANGENGSEATEDHADKQWRLVACDAHWEGPPMSCEHCEKLIESAYGDPAEDAPTDH